MTSSQLPLAYLFFKVLTNHEDLKTLLRRFDFMSTMRIHWQVLSWEYGIRAILERSCSEQEGLGRKMAWGKEKANVSLLLTSFIVSMTLRITLTLSTMILRITLQGLVQLALHILESFSPILTLLHPLVSLSSLDMPWFVSPQCLCTCCSVVFPSFPCHLCSSFKFL